MRSLLLLIGLTFGLILSGPLGGQTKDKDTPVKDSVKDKKDAPKDKATPKDKDAPKDKTEKDKGGKETPRDKAVNINLDHIFNGGINRNGDLVGIHHYPSAPKEMEVEGKKCKVEFFFQNKGGPEEVTTARVQCRDPESRKILAEKFSTLFPAGWTREQIEKAIREAIYDAREEDGIEPDGKWGGTCGAGFRIEGYLAPNKKTITTAFPIYKKK